MAVSAVADCTCTFVSICPPSATCIPGTNDVPVMVSTVGASLTAMAGLIVVRASVFVASAGAQVARVAGHGVVTADGSASIVALMLATGVTVATGTVEGTGEAIAVVSGVSVDFGVLDTDTAAVVIVAGVPVIAGVAV